jgi:hypothetical protein
VENDEGGLAATIARLRASEEAAAAWAASEADEAARLEAAGELSAAAAHFAASRRKEGDSKVRV